MGLFSIRQGRAGLLGGGAPTDMPDWLQESLRTQVGPSLMSGNDVWRMRMMMDIPEHMRSALGGFSEDRYLDVDRSQPPGTQGEMPDEGVPLSAAPLSVGAPEEEVLPTRPFGPTPEDVTAALPNGGTGAPIVPRPIPRAYFENAGPSALERAGKYVDEVGDAFARSAANNMIPNSDIGDRFTAEMGALTGIDGVRGDYKGNLKRQLINSELAKIKSPTADTVGEAVGSFLGGGLSGRLPTIQGGIKAMLKDRSPPPPPRKRPKLRIPLKSPPRFRDD